MKTLERLKLPALPVAAQKILSLDMTSDRDQDALIPAICQCPVTTARIISLANSNEFGISGLAISSAKQAVQRIGLRTAFNTALACAMSSLAKPNKNSLLDQDKLWKHNLEMIKLVSSIASYLPSVSRPASADISLACLLHDIGLIAFDAMEPSVFNHFSKALQQTNDADKSALEQKFFGVTHAELGATLLSSWSIPNIIIEPVRHHHNHNVDCKTLSVLSKLLIVADVLSSDSQYRNEAYHDELSMSDMAKLLALSVEQMEVIVNDLQQKGLPVALKRKNLELPINFDEAIKAHLNWKTKFRVAITNKESLDWSTISNDACCTLGKWLHGDAKSQYHDMVAFQYLFIKHAQFHAEAGKIALMVNNRNYIDAECAIDQGSSYDIISKSVIQTIINLRKEMESINTA